MASPSLPGHSDKMFLAFPCEHSFRRPQVAFGQLFSPGEAAPTGIHG